MDRKKDEGSCFSLQILSTSILSSKSFPNLKMSNGWKDKRCYMLGHVAQTSDPLMTYDIKTQ